MLVGGGTSMSCFQNGLECQNGDTFYVREVDQEDPSHRLPGFTAWGFPFYGNAVVVRISPTTGADCCPRSKLGTIVKNVKFCSNEMLQTRIGRAGD